MLSYLVTASAPSNELMLVKVESKVFAEFWQADCYSDKMRNAGYRASMHKGDADDIDAPWVPVTAAELSMLCFAEED